MPTETHKFYNLADLSRQRLVKLRDEPPVLYSTGLTGVDKLLRGGFAPGEMAIVAALTTHGKTMFMSNLAYQFAFAGTKTLFLSEEMTVEQLADRSLAYATELPEQDWMACWESLFQDVTAFYDVRASMLVSKPVIEVDRACDAISQAVEHHGVKVVFVDYLQKLRGKGTDELAKLTYVSNTLSTHAATTGATIIAGAQFNRESTKDANFCPKVSFIKGSSYIEQDAAVILMLVWPHMLAPPDGDVTKRPPATDYHIYCGKNRNRGIGSWADASGNMCPGFCKVAFEAEHQRLSDNLPPVMAAIQDRKSQGYINDFDAYNNF